MTRYAPGMRYETLQDELDARDYFDTLKGLEVEEAMRESRAELLGSAPEPSSQVQQKPESTQTPVASTWISAAFDGMYPGYELTLWHYRYLQFWRKSHDKSCPCGQPDDGEEAREVSLYLT